MEYEATPLNGAFLLHLDKKIDERGFFSRQFDVEEASNYGVDFRIAQVNTSFSPKKGTLRGLHLQSFPNGEHKFLRCISGRIFDVIVDCRKQSNTFGQWFGVELSANDRVGILVPRGCAHGFMTLEEDSEVFYLTSNAFAAESEMGIRWDDATIGIHWPSLPKVISDKDSQIEDVDLNSLDTGY